MTAEQEAALNESQKAYRAKESHQPQLSQAHLTSFKIDFHHAKVKLIKQALVNPFTCSARRANSIILKRGTESNPDNSLIDPYTLHQNSFANGLTTESLYNSVNDNLWFIQSKEDGKHNVLVANGSDEMPQF